MNFIQLSILVIFFFTYKNLHAINLSDAISSAQINNRNIKLEQIKLNAIKTEKIKAIAEFLPNISANASYAQRNSFYKGQTFDRSTRQRTEEIKLEQPIFDGFHSVFKYNEANYKIKSVSAKKSDKIQEISYIAIQSYCNLFRYQELIKLHEENKKFSQKFLELVNRRKEMKIIDKADIIKFTYETSVIEEKYFDILNRLNKAKFDYKNIIGELHENLNYPAISAEEFNKEKILESALVNNHNIKSYQYNYLASKSALNAEKSNFSPKVTLTALANKQDKVVYLDNQDINSRSVSLNLTVPIFQRGIEYANVAKAKYDSEAASVEFEITRENIIKELNQALEEYVFFQKINKNNKKLFELAKNRAEIFAKRSNLKVEDPIEVIRTNIEANDRKINYIESDMNFIIAHYKIKYYLGEI